MEIKENKRLDQLILDNAELEKKKSEKLKIELNQKLLERK